MDSIIIVENRPGEKYDGRKVGLKNNLKAIIGDFVQAARERTDV